MALFVALFVSSELWVHLNRYEVVLSKSNIECDHGLFLILRGAFQDPLMDKIVFSRCHPHDHRPRCKEKDQTVARNERQPHCLELDRFQHFAF